MLMDGTPVLSETGVSVNLPSEAASGDGGT